MIRVDIEGLQQAMDRLDQVGSPTIKKRLLRQVARQILKNSRQRTTHQIDLQGQPYRPHAKGRKRKMLTRLSRAKHMNIVRLDTEGVLIGFRNPVLERIAAKQQFGFRERMTAAKMAQRNPRPPEAPATRAQAKALRDQGYRVRKPNGRYVTPTLKWITENMSQGRAGIILRALRGGARREWETVLPPRSFLGINDQDQQALNALIIRELEHALES